MNILGVKIDNLAKREILEKIENFLRESKFHQIATINPEFILRAQKDEKFKNILNNCDLNVADGVGTWFAFLRFGKYLKTRMTGVDLMEEILKIASENNYKIFLAVSDGGLSSYENTREAILKEHPNLEIGRVNLDKNTTNYKIQATSYDIVFCNFGAPEQEKFLHSLKDDKNANIKLVMGIGGSFDFITGKIKRAPVFMRKLGLEWLWRLILEPKYRFKRIINAIVIFPIKILLSKK